MCSICLQTSTLQYKSMPPRNAAALEPEIALPEPRDNTELFGHEDTEKFLLNLWYSGRMPHAIILAGGKGIGKATLAYRFARFVLSPSSETGGGLFSMQADSMHMAAEDPVFRRVSSGSHADLLVLEPAFDAKKDEYKKEIVVEDARRVGEFLSLTPAEAQWRVVVIDSVDDLNRNAANSLLKILEEPPSQALLLLVCHNPGRLLPTIRSRCRVIKLKPPQQQSFEQVLKLLLPDVTMKQAGLLEYLADGSAGLAVDIYKSNGIMLYEELITLVGAPNMQHIQEFTESVAGKNNLLWKTAMRLVQVLLSQTIRHASGDKTVQEIAAGEHEVIARLLALKPLDYWLQLWEKTGELYNDEVRIHLDRRQAMISILHGFEGIIPA